MTFQDLFTKLGAFIFDHPESASMPVSIRITAPDGKYVEAEHISVQFNEDHTGLVVSGVDL